MRIPSFLFRVYTFRTEFEVFSQKASLQHPVAITTDFALHVCNDREAAIRGISRCMDIKDAFLSLQKKGHFLNSSSLLLLVPDGLNPIRSTDGQRRHLSMDASTTLPLRGNSREYPTTPSSAIPSLSRYHNDSSTFLSHTPLLGASSLFDPLSTDDPISDFSLSHQTSLLSPSYSTSSWNDQSLFSFHPHRSTSSQTIINNMNSLNSFNTMSSQVGTRNEIHSLDSLNDLNTSTELWNEPSSLHYWRGDSSSSVGVRHSIDSTTSHNSFLSGVNNELYNSAFERIDDNSRSNSLGMNSSLNYPQPRSFYTPTLTTLSGKNDLSDGFSLTRQATVPSISQSDFGTLRREDSSSLGSPDSFTFGLSSSRGSSILSSRTTGRPLNRLGGIGNSMNNSMNSSNHPSLNNPFNNKNSKGKPSGMNPHSAEFVPSFMQSQSQSQSQQSHSINHRPQRDDRWMNKREALV